MLGIIVPIIVTIYVYKQAKETGRNPILWSFINLAVFFGIQILLGFAIGLGMAISGAEESITQYTLPINLVCLVVAGVGSYFVVRHVTRIPDEMFQELPPPPPKF